MTRSCEKEEQEVHFEFAPLRVAPLHLVANPIAGREHEYAAPQAGWLDTERVMRVVRNPTGFVQHKGNVSPADLKRAADFLWTLNCRFEKPQISILQWRKPFPPRLSRYPQRPARSGFAFQETDRDSQA